MTKAKPMADSHTSQSEAVHANDTRTSPVRVVLVGHGDCIDDLNGDGVDLVRARTPLEAVGEVACPPAPAEDVRTVVLLTPGAGLNGTLDAFVNAVRLADPAARIARVDCDEFKASDRFDAVVGPRVTSASIRLILDPSGEIQTKPGHAGANQKNAGAQPEIKPVAERESVAEYESKTEPAMLRSDHSEQAGIECDEIIGDVFSEGSEASVDALGESVGDGVMLRLLSGGRDGLIRAGLSLIKSRLGIEGVVFIDSAGPDQETQPVPSVPVSSGNRRFGALRATEVTAELLIPHAAWLGSWLGLRERQQMLRRSAFTDPLTGAWNRRYFDSFLEAALNRARETRRTVTVLIFDIDEFKKYNDNYGHPAGDEILIETVRALKASVRPSDRVCRIGGDEFAVIFDEPEGPRQAGSRPPESVYVLAKRVQRKIGESEFPKLGADAAGQLTISGGLAAFPWDGHDPETLLHRADDLACQSKRAGKNAITLGPGAQRVCGHEGDNLCDR